MSERKVNYGSYTGKRGLHPKIRVEGQYLRRFGFDIGDVVDVAVENEKIIITKVHKAKDESRNTEMQSIRSVKGAVNDQGQTR